MLIISHMLRNYKVHKIKYTLIYVQYTIYIYILLKTSTFNFIC